MKKKPYNHSSCSGETLDEKKPHSTTRFKCEACLEEFCKKCAVELGGECPWCVPALIEIK